MGGLEFFTIFFEETNEKFVKAWLFQVKFNFLLKIFFQSNIMT